MTTPKIVPQLTENAETVLKARYLLGDETSQDLFARVAKAVAQAEQPADRARWEETYYEVMAVTRFVPNSPTLFNAGTGQGTLSACFVLPIDDTMESIMHATTTSAMIQKFGGGIGYSFSNLRPRGSHITSTQGKACGAIAVLKMLSALSDMITQGGKRHGANMGILHVSHPEVMQFIHMKDDDETAQNFNISVAVTDAFMKAVENDEEWQLVAPNTTEVVETLPARRIWNEIIESAWGTGDPGLYFIDEANRHNPTPHLGHLDSTNPCGEVPLLAFEACNLGSIDLGKFVQYEASIGASGHTGKASFDFKGLEEVARVGARFLDDVVSINSFPATEVADAVARTRKTGLGVMGWHDALIRLGIEYESEEALTMAQRVMGTITNAAREVSIGLAQERGAYPAWQPASPGEPPIRNASRTCIAPTGSISAIAAASSGIEPVFALAFVKNVLDGKHLREVNQDFERIARERGFYSDELMEEMARTGSCQHLDQVPDDVKRLFKVANEISVDTHVKMQAAFQAHTDLAVSKTINMARSATVEDVENAYWMSFRNRCKGITVYRDGSKGAQVLEVQGKQTPEDAQGQVLDKPRERPASMEAVVDRVRTGHGNTYVTISFDQDRHPFEVFTTLGKAGSCDSANLEAISRLISLALRSGVPSDAVVDQLQGITCHPVWDQGVLVRSVPDALSSVLKKYAEPTGAELPGLDDMYGTQLGMAMPNGGNGGNGNGKHSSGQICPECGGPVAFQEGCAVCQACAWNQCGG